MTGKPKASRLRGKPMKSGVRSPTAHRTLEQAREASPKGKPAQHARTVKRVQARRAMEKAGKVSKGDGKDVDHRTPISQGGSNAPKNLRVSSRSKNRGHPR